MSFVIRSKIRVFGMRHVTFASPPVATFTSVLYTARQVAWIHGIACPAALDINNGSSRRRLERR